MPMPPHVQMRLIKESLVGKTGTERAKILRGDSGRTAGVL